ncbi:MAG: nuclear transport factor 2 family protein [Fimbriimonas sp.]
MVASIPEHVPDRYPTLLRAKYNEFARGLEKGDPGFLRFIDPGFVYIDPNGRKMGAKEWTEGMRQACLRNRDPKVRFRITEVRQRKNRVLVSYVWSYRYKSGVATRPLPRLTESISTDTWKVVGKDLKMIVSKDYHYWHRPARREDNIGY